ncbi:Uncharacterized protein Adt_12792 [Abeliophyllum distichum]|uniref:Uncharacterized protein n=1 Tax=Abeliophyllum distichum TaxID=126358 RepID=A0ABD1USR8_9LAMI
MQEPDPPQHLQPGFNLHTGSDPKPVEPLSNSRPGNHTLRLVEREGKRLNGESRRHVLSLACVDLSGGDEHEPHLSSCVQELQGAVVVRENCSVGVVDGGVLGEGEVDGAVGGGKGRELDGGDGDFRLFGFENCEVND